MDCASLVSAMSSREMLEKSCLTRYRYLNRLVSDSNQHLNTAETTLGIGWRF